MRLRMGEDGDSSVSWRQGLGTAGRKSWETTGGRKNFQLRRPGMKQRVLIGLTFVLGSLVSCISVHLPERVAEMRALEVESAARLTVEGESLFRGDRVKLSGYEYCSVAVRLCEQGEVRRGIREASKALFLGQISGDDDLLAHAYRDLAYAYSLAGYLEHAERFADEAIQHMRRSPRDDHRRVLGPSYKVRGDVHLRQGHVSEAIVNYQQALSASDGSFRPFVLSSLANAYLANGDPAKARHLFRQAEAGTSDALRPLIHRGLGHVALAESRYQEAIRWFTEATAQLTGANQAYHQLWALEGIAQARLATGDRAGAIEAYMQAIATAEQVRTRFRSEEFKTGFFGDIQQIFDEAIALLMENAQVEAAFDVSERSRARALLDLVRNRVQMSVDALTLADPFGQAISASQLRAVLPEGVAVVEYHVLPRRTYAWVIRRSGITPVALEVSRETLRHAVRHFQKSIRRQAINIPRIVADLYEQLVHPLGLAGAESVVVIPHDALHYLPFQALHGPMGYLIEERTISYAPSSSVLVQLLTKEPEQRGRVLALGNPDLGTPRLALPGAQREVERIKAIFPSTEVYVRQEATKERLMAQAPQSHLVHIAAHAEVDEIDPLNSVIRLARKAKLSGKLRAHEVFRMSLPHTALTVLSACDTGLGRISRGDELWGFSRAFLSAGTRALLVSLWPVDDESTAQLMVRFYEELRKGATHRALRTAQLEVLQNVRFSHPFFWAPFDLIGDWR
jgi:CHAT domain-containing protein